MASFEHLFKASNGKPIEYGGRTLILVDRFPTNGARQLLLVEERHGEWRQGVALRLVQKGDLTINGQRMKHAVCWQDTAPEAVEIGIPRNVDTIAVNNIWDTGDGVTESWHNGAAMIVEELPDGRRYRCSDGHPDEDFDDIVFRVERRK